MTNLDSILKSRDITLPTKIRLVKAMVFPVVMYGCESWIVKKAETEKLMLCNCGVADWTGISRVRLFVTPWIAARQASLSITNSPVHPNPCPLSQWCHPTISSSVVPFSSWLQSFPASGSFPMSWLFASGGQSIAASSSSSSVLPMNIQDWFPLGWTGWISLQSKGLSRVFSNTTVRKHQFFSTQLSSGGLSTII